MKILILSCSTGGGHNAAAYAMKEQFDMRNIKCDVKEFLDIFNIKMARIVNKAYIKTTTNNGKCFKTVYKLGELYDKTNLTSPVYRVNSITKKKLYKYIIENGYNYVIATHLFPAQAMTALRKKYNIGFATIATDYESIPFWKEVFPDFFIIPHKDLINDFVKKKIPKNKLIPMGIPVSYNYSKKTNKKELIQELRLNSSKKYIMVMSGSMGFGKVEEIIEGLDKKLDDNYCIIAACGNNNEMVNNIQSKYSKSRVIALTFTKQIYKYIHVSEVILSKPGGLSTTEICTANIPLIHTMPIPGCETKNADFFENKKMSIKCNDVSKCVMATLELLNNNKKREHMKQCQRENIDIYAASNICDYILKHMNDNTWENENIKKKGRILKTNINEKYKYINNNFFFKIISFLVYYIIAVPVIWLLGKIKYNFKVKGKNNLKEVLKSDKAAISISNHIAYIDCALLGIAALPTRIYYTTTEENFKIPFVRHLIKILYGIPIPNSINGKKYFIKGVEDILKNGNIVHIYPEASLKPYYNKIRNFKDGAFNIAVKCDVPILPFVFTYNEVKGVRKLFKKYPDITLKILPPIYPSKDISNDKEKIEKLKNDTKKIVECNFEN